VWSSFIQLFNYNDAASLEFKKRTQPVLTDIFNFEAKPPGPFKIVKMFNKNYNYGKPKEPKLPTWIHSIPIRLDLLSPEEKILCEKLAVCLFFAVFGQRLRGKN